MKFLTLTLHLLTRLTLTLIATSTVIGCFYKVNFQKGINIVIGSFKKYFTKKMTVFRPPSPPCHHLPLIRLTPSLHWTNSEKLFMRIHDLRVSVPLCKLHACCYDMQKFRARRALLVVAFKANAVDNRV